MTKSLSLIAGAWFALAAGAALAEPPAQSNDAETKSVFLCTAASSEFWISVPGETPPSAGP